MTPFAEDHLNELYGLLFCDGSRIDPALGSGHESLSEAELRTILDDSTAESRLRLAAASRLRELGSSDIGNHLFGVIVEVGMDEGLDVLAVYEDGTARYINYSGKLVIWETRTATSDQLAEDLLNAGRQVIQQIGSWEGDRLPPPAAGNARLTFLAADGLYFGEGPFEVLAGDPMGGAVIEKAGLFMAFLVDQAMNQSP